MSDILQSSPHYRSIVSILIAFTSGLAIFFLLNIGQIQAVASFNENFNGTIDSYTTHGDNADFYHVNDAADARSGKGALKIVSRNSMNVRNNLQELTRWIGKIDSFEVTPGEEYRVEVYMRAEAVRDSARLSVSFFENNKGSSWLKTTTASQKITTAGDWELISVVVTVPADAKFMRPEFRLFDKGTIFIDDLAVVNLSDDSPGETAPEEPVDPVTQPGEQVVIGEPIEVEINQPPVAVGEEEFSVNFEAKPVISAKAVPADQQMRISFLSNCDLSHRAPDDPIVFPGQHGASHSHDFFGDSMLSASSTTQSLLDNAESSCLPEDDRSAYWVPTVYDNDKAHDPHKPKMYYKAGFVKPSTLEDMPLGLRIIAGNANAQANQSPQVGFWYSSGDLSSPEAVPNLNNSTRGKKQMVSAKSGEGITLRINFPQCWDGENLWLPNSAHMAYPGKRGSNGYAKCPDTHPHPLPMVLMIIDYPNANGGSDFSLSSGDWHTFHADFVNAWHPAALDGLVQTCLRGETRCRQVRSNTCNARGLGSARCEQFSTASFE